MEKCGDCGTFLGDEYASWIESGDKCDSCGQTIRYSVPVCDSCDEIRELSAEQFNIEIGSMEE